MILPYTQLPQAAGKWPRPLLDVAFGDVEDVFVPCLVDSGAVQTLIPEWVANDCGTDLEGVPEVIFGVGGASTRARFAIVRLSAAGRTWEAEVGFCTPWPYSWGLLGHASFFRYFTVMFQAADGLFELVPLEE